ncbi:MAG: non-heme iron oxygenase ferredoxin subunit [Actinomycetota bacterium]|nr:non-heme iron oxygenase ferredoxin subunit [Actinomycetota bacterium]
MTVGEGFRRACLLEEVPDPGAHRVEFDDIDVAIVRSDGAVYAIEDVCSHAEVALSEGDVEGSTIECWMHGSCFDLCSGAPTGPPATEPVDVFDVQVIDGVVYVNQTARATKGPRQNLSAVLKQKEQATS